MTSAIAVEHLDKSFGGFHAVQDVGFDAPEGQITALLGPSGSGKSTVLRMIAGLERPSGGRILIAGEEQTYKTVQERTIGFVFQHYALFRHMTVRDNIGFGLSVRKQDKASIRARVDELLELVQLTPFANRYPDQLSGGQRQRVALARALAPKPKVLLLDEPFGALDARVRQDLRRWLDELHRELGVTSLLVTHDQDEALELATKVVVMSDGRVEQTGTPNEIYNEPATPFIAGFVGAANVIRGLVINGRVQFGEDLMPGAGKLQDGAPAHAYVRPHDVRLSALADGARSCPVTVERMTNLGWMSKLHLRLTDGQMLVAELRNEDVNGVAVGARVYADLGKAQVFSPDGSEAIASDELAAL
ncbi:MAG TPA: sulfate/molybdate ABC transporter ATP-binding protein [Actinomycetota bacterium]|nr:sulfate/molybdate ABC transporter ATP-binding protein [Actinomycetota bacterium]